MSRYLKGIQWLTDTYKAAGSEYQPEVQPVSYEMNVEQQITVIENEISGIGGRIDDIDTSIGGISGDIDGLSGRVDTAEGDIDDLEGDVSSIASAVQDLQSLISYGTADLNPGVTTLATGHVYLMYE